MEIFRAVHRNGTNIKVGFGGFQGCCGGRIIASYEVHREDGRGIARSAKYIRLMHTQLFNYIRSKAPESVVVCMDPVNVGQSGWSGGTLNSSHEGAASLQNFCIDNDFDVHSYAKGRHGTSRKLGVFTKGGYDMDGNLLAVAYEEHADVKIQYDDYEEDDEEW